MFVITSDGTVLKADGNLTGRSVIAFFAEPDDKIEDISNSIRTIILHRIEPPASFEQMRSALDSLRKHLLHNSQLQPEQRHSICLDPGHCSVQSNHQFLEDEKVRACLNLLRLLLSG